MGASPRLYKFQSYMVNHSEPGVATDVFVIPQYYWSNADIINEMEVVGTPVPLIYTEPLLTMPGVRTWEENAPDINALRREVRRRMDVAVLAWDFHNFTALLPVDETPIFVQKLFDEVALVNRQLRRDRQQEDAINAEWGGRPLYNLPFLNYNMTVCYLLEEIQRHMLEPIIDCGVTWQLWSENEVINYLRERISRFLVETGIVIDRGSFDVLAGQSSYDLISTLAELRRVDMGSRGLVPMDYWSADYGVPGWQGTSAEPYAFFEDPLTPLSVQLVPTPSTSGSAVYTYVKSTPLEAPAEDGLPEGEKEDGLGNYYLRIPSIFSWAIKYGVMADMLSKEGEANDPERASYCENRFKEGIELAKLMIYGEVNAQ